MPQSRRSFLATIGAALGTAACAGRTHALRSAGPGLQLYTVRAAMRSDLEGTLACVAAIGYRTVEFAGYFDRTPAQIAALLTENGLSSPSTHIGFDEMRTDWDRALDAAARIGHAWVTVPWIAAEHRRSADDWKRVAELFNARAETARTAGLRFAYHNHDFEFARVADVVPYEILLQQTADDLVDFQLDVYWTAKAGFDAVELFRRHPRRFAMTHLKDSAGPPDHRMVDVGAGILDFARILAAARDAGVQHHFVEHDQPADPFVSITSSYRHIAALQY
jgi:sugar phosphate isomerase/epimerase